MSRSKQVGTAAETAVVQHLRINGYPHAERRALTGSHDKGDISGIPDTVVEVKAGRTPKYQAWLREAAVEALNAGASLGVVLHKPYGVGTARTGDWSAVMTFDQWLMLMIEAGRVPATQQEKGNP